MSNTDDPGRTKPPTPRPIRFAVILSEDEYARLDHAADKEGITRADVVRRHIRTLRLPRPAGGITRGE